MDIHSHVCWIYGTPAIQVGFTCLTSGLSGSLVIWFSCGSPGSLMVHGSILVHLHISQISVILFWRYDDRIIIRSNDVIIWGDDVIIRSSDVIIWSDDVIIRSGDVIIRQCDWSFHTQLDQWSRKSDQETTDLPAVFGRFWKSIEIGGPCHQGKRFVLFHVYLQNFAPKVSPLPPDLTSLACAMVSSSI